MKSDGVQNVCTRFGGVSGAGNSYRGIDGSNSELEARQEIEKSGREEMVSIA